MRYSIPRFIARKPAWSVAAVIVVTVLLGATYVLFGGEMEASERLFLPDTDVVNASMEISRDFQTAELVQILVKSKSGNVFTPGCLTEMLEAEKAIVENESISMLLLPV